MPGGVRHGIDIAREAVERQVVGTVIGEAAATGVVDDQPHRFGDSFRMQRS